jgi:hypothetical protein
MYAYFSNTLGEFEVFARSGIMFWPRGKHLVIGRTPFQRKFKEEAAAEDKGDIVFLLSGSKIKGFQWEFKKRIYQIKETPNLVFRGKVIDIIQRPIICYRFHPQLSNKEVNLPLDFFEYLYRWDNYLGKILTHADKIEIRNVVRLKEIIGELSEKLEYEKKNEENGGIYPKFVLSKFSKNILLKELRSRYADANWRRYLDRLDTWRQKEYVKVELEADYPLLLHLEINLVQGISTRQLSFDELYYSYKLKEYEKQSTQKM